MGERPKQVTTIEGLEGKTIAKAWKAGCDERFLILFTDVSTTALWADVDEDAVLIDVSNKPLELEELVEMGFMTYAQANAERARLDSEAKAARLAMYEATEREELARLKAKYEPTVKG